MNKGEWVEWLNEKPEPMTEMDETAAMGGIILFVAVASFIVVAAIIIVLGTTDWSSNYVWGAE